MKDGNTAMQIEINLPPQIEAAVKASLGDLEGAAREAVLIDLYRRELLTRRELGDALELDRFETEKLLKDRNVFDGSVSLEDIAVDRDTIDRVLGRTGTEPH